MTIRNLPPKRAVAVAVAIGAAAILAAGGGVGFYLHRYADSTVGGDLPTKFTIPRGTPLTEVNQILIDAGLIPEGKAFILLARIFGDGKKIKAGAYRVGEKISARELLAMLVKGEIVQRKFTIVEGASFADIKAQLLSDSRFSHSLDKMDDGEILRAVGANESHPEGIFFPDTYLFEENSDDLALLRRAYLKMHEHLADEWDKRDFQTPLASPYDALILASIVEKETARDGEHGLVASVFINRLKRGMRLQADPTVIYGMGDSYGGKLRRKDLRNDTPYNTYTRKGLPPTPIAAPGLAALRAAIRPPKTPYFYFVATGEDGAHEFSETLRQHNRAVVRYRRKLREKN